MIECIGIVDIGGGEEGRRRELVGFLTVIFQVQLIKDIMHEGQTIRDEPVVDHDDVDRWQLRRDVTALGRSPARLSKHTMARLRTIVAIPVVGADCGAGPAGHKGRGW